METLAKPRHIQRSDVQALLADAVFRGDIPDDEDIALRTYNDCNGTLLAYGDQRVAQGILSTAKRILVLSDSTWTRNAEAIMRPWFASNRIKAASGLDAVSGGTGSGGMFVWGSAGYLGTQNYSPYGAAFESLLPTTFGADDFWHSIRISETTFQDDMTPTSTFGTTYGNITGNAMVFSGSILEKSKTAGLRVTVEHLVGPHGTAVACFRIVVRKHDGTYLGTSAPFSNYAATASVQTITIDIASWTETTDNLISVMVKGVGGTAPGTDKYYVGLKTTIQTLDTVSTNQLWESISFGGEGVATYLDTTKLSATAWSRINANNYDAVVIALGINAYGNPDLPTWIANYQAIINKIRAVNTTLPILMTNELKLAPDADPVFGTYLATLKSLALANPKTLLINTADQCPSQLVLFPGWTIDWQSGAYYSLGDQVRDAVDNKVYSHKVLAGSRLTTRPGLDATNWNASTSAYDGTVVNLTNQAKNALKADAIHPHNAGRRLYASIIWRTLECVARRY